MFSSSWTERQGQVGDLRHQSREELQELLLRQEKILSNNRLFARESIYCSGVSQLKEEHL